MDSAPEVDLPKPSSYDFDMDRQSVARIAGLLGMLPSKWTLAGQVEEDSAEAERAKRKRERQRSRTAKRVNGRNLANRLIYENHRRRSIVRLMHKGIYAPGTRYERFRPLEVIQAHRKAICEWEGFPASTSAIGKANGIGRRYIPCDLRWLASRGYVRQIVKGGKTGPGGVPRPDLWARTEKPFEGYRPGPLHAGTYRNKAMTDADREAALEAETQAAINRMQAKISRTVQTRNGKPIQAMADRRRRLPPADYARIKAEREARRPRELPGIGQASVPGSRRRGRPPKRAL